MNKIKKKKKTYLAPQRFQPKPKEQREEKFRDEVNKMGENNQKPKDEEGLKMELLTYCFKKFSTEA